MYKRQHSGSFGKRDVNLALADDGHVVGVELGVEDFVGIAVGSHDEKSIVWQPSVTIFASVVGVGLKTLLLHYPNSVVSDKVLTETCGRTNRYLIVICAFDNGFKREFLVHFGALASE